MLAQPQQSKTVLDEVVEQFEYSNSRLMSIEKYLIDISGKLKGYEPQCEAKSTGNPPSQQCILSRFSEVYNTQSQLTERITYIIHELNKII